MLTLEDLAGPDAHAALRSLRDHAPVAWVEALAGWLVTGHAESLAVVRDAGTFTVDHPDFSTAQVVGPSMLSLDGSEHHRHRVPFGTAFRPARLTAHLAPRVDELAAGLVDAMRPDGRADLRTQLAGPLSAGVMAEALGLPAVDAPTVLQWYTAIVGAVTDITAGRPPSPDAAAAMAELDAAVRAAAGDEFSLLGNARQRLSDSEVTSNAAVLLFGGIETTEGMIANAALHLLRHRDVMAFVRADRSLVPAAVEESLRLEPAAAVIDRYATRDVLFGAVGIRSGDLVRVSLAGANRDPQVFAEPDRFVLGRDRVLEQLAFARGPHTCIAMDLARLETRAALHAVLDGLPPIRLAGPATVGGLVFRKPDSVPVAWN